MIELREYQKRGIDELYQAIRDGFKRIAWVFPTGAGKSTVCSRFVKSCVVNKKRVLFAVHSEELVLQFRDRLIDQFGVASGVIMAGHKASPERLVQVASVMTLVRRKHPEADVVIIDESHRAKAKTYKSILENYQGKLVIGLTATPFRADGKGLNDVFEKIVHPVKIRELINLGHLVPTKVFVPENAVDLSGIKTSMGDYSKKQMFERYNDIAVYQGVVQNYLLNAKGKKAAAFNINIEQSKKLTEQFIAHGVPAAHLDGTTPKQIRRQVIQDFDKGKIQVLNNVGLFTEGFDIPAIDCVIINRATKSLGLYVQIVGRGLRPAKGKEFCTVLDHGGNTLRHGFAEDYDACEFNLEGITKKKGVAPTKNCPECQEVLYNSIRNCKCGFEFKIEEKKKFGEATAFQVLEWEDVMLSRLESLQYRTAKNLPLSQLRIFEKVKGYKNGWWIHNAIDRGLIDLERGSSGFWKKANFLVQIAEIEAGTHELYKKLTREKSNKEQAVRA